MQQEKNFTLFSGRSHPSFAKEVADFLHVELGKVTIQDFPDGEIGVRINENVRGRDVFVLQSLARQPNFYLMELLIMVDALKRAFAKTIVVVLPYFCYARQDRKDKGREPITAKLIADLLERVGVACVMTMDLHTEQIQGFFDIPVDNLYARPALIQAVKGYGITDCVVVTPDIGSVKLAREFSAELGVDMAIINKRRLDAEQVEANALIGDVEGKDVLFVDDIYSTGGTMKKGAMVCKALGARRVFGAVTHGLMIGDSKVDSLIEKLFITNTLPPRHEMVHTSVEVVTVAPLFGRAIQSFVQGGSISSLFKPT